MSSDSDRLSQRLLELIYFLHRSCVAYDEGITAEALSLSVSVRNLFHDTGSTHSLAGQLGLLESLSMYDTSSPFGGEHNDAGWTGLTFMAMPHNSYLPRLDDETPDASAHFTPFRGWWEQVVIQEPEGFSFTRETVVLAMANQDGAHVDPTLHAAYERLMEQGLGWLVQGSNKPVPLLVEATIRQIAHETLVSLAHRNDVGFPAEVPRRRYRYLPGPSVQDVFRTSLLTSGMRITTLDDTGSPRLGTTTGWPDRIGRNDPCPCGSGKKYKRCHGYE